VAESAGRSKEPSGKEMNMADPVLQRGDSGPNVAEAQNLLNRDGAMLDLDGSFGDDTDSALRDFQARNDLTPLGVINDATWATLRALPELPADVPMRALAMIVNLEVTSRQVYVKKYTHPLWPKGASGITIGVGYDIGQQSRAQFESDWGDVCTANEMDQLRPWVGVAGQRAQAGEAPLAGIVIPWQKAWMVFIRRSIPAYTALTRKAFNVPAQLPAPCVGALVSMVYNRGAGIGNGDRDKEKRDIRAALAAGRPQDVPKALRDMKQRFPDNPGLQNRREEEAQMFEEGLKQAGLSG
jgi:hypothetical protein